MRKNNDYSRKYRRIGIICETRRKDCVLFHSRVVWRLSFIKPFLPEIEAENPDFTFVEVNRDDYMEVAKKWDVYGIPSLVVLENGQEIGRFVNRERKTKTQINEFLAQLN